MVLTCLCLLLALSMPPCVFDGGTPPPPDAVRALFPSPGLLELCDVESTSPP